MKLTIPTVIDHIRERGAIPALLMINGRPAELIELWKCEKCGCDCVGPNPLVVSRQTALMSHFFGVCEVAGPLPELQPIDGGYGCEDCANKE